MYLRRINYLNTLIKFHNNTLVAFHPTQTFRLQSQQINSSAVPPTKLVRETSSKGLHTDTLKVW